MNFDTNEKQIKDFFIKCGPINLIKLMRRPDGKSKGKCFIKFRD